MNVVNQIAMHVYVHRSYPGLPESIPTSGITRDVVQIWSVADLPEGEMI